jgi:Lrp/AsnC family transcriptional regulator, regulator for asnA, asnC and gidA
VQKNRPQLDETARFIIRELQRDGRMTIQALAQRVGASEVTVRRRLRKLEADGTIAVVAVVDPFLAGFDAPALIKVQVERRSIDRIAQEIAKNPAVTYVAAATGFGHLLVELHAESNQALASYLFEELGAIEGVLDTETTVILRVYKQTLK